MISKFEQYEKIFSTLTRKLGSTEAAISEIRESNNKLMESIGEEDLLKEIEFIKEGLLDDAKNTFSKWFFGSMGKVGKIDKYREAILDAEMEQAKKSSYLKDQYDVLEVKARSSYLDPAQSKSLEVQMDNKKREIDATKKALSAEIADYERKIKKAIGDNQRRREYFEAKRSEDLARLAKYELDIVTERTSPRRIKEIEQFFNKAQEEAREKAKSFIQKMRSSSDMEGTPPDTKDLERNLKSWLSKSYVEDPKLVKDYFEYGIDSPDVDKFIESLFEIRKVIDDLDRKIDRIRYELDNRRDYYVRNPEARESAASNLKKYIRERKQLSSLVKPFLDLSSKLTKEDIERAKKAFQNMKDKSSKAAVVLNNVVGRG